MSQTMPDEQGLLAVAQEILTLIGVKGNVSVDSEKLVVTIALSGDKEPVETESAYHYLLNLENMIKPYRFHVG